MTLHIVQTLPMCALVLILLCLATERHGVTQIRVLRQWDPHIQCGVIIIHQSVLDSVTNFLGFLYTGQR